MRGQEGGEAREFSGHLAVILGNLIPLLLSWHPFMFHLLKSTVAAVFFLLLLGGCAALPDTEFLTRRYTKQAAALRLAA